MLTHSNSSSGGSAPDEISEDLLAINQRDSPQFEPIEIEDIKHEIDQAVTTPTTSRVTVEVSTMQACMTPKRRQPWLQVRPCESAPSSAC